jgi:trehalose synthase
LLQPVSVGHKALGDYRHLIGRALVDEINELAEPLKGKRVLHLSATAMGGGVSEILYALVPLMRDAGLETDWHIILGREEFFNVTKLMHNALQGNPHGLTKEDWEIFDRYNKLNAS